MRAVISGSPLGLLFALLTLSVLGGCAPPGRAAFRAADEAYAAGRFEDAAAAYAEAPIWIGEAWRSYGAWRAAAIWRDNLHDTDRAERTFVECARRYPGSDWGYGCQVELGNLRRDHRKPRAALDAYRAALQMRPGGSYSEHCLLEGGRAYLAVGEHEQARIEWKELLLTFPGTGRAEEIAVETARSWDLEGKPREALASWLEVEQRWPRSLMEAVVGQAESHDALGNFAEAERLYQRALTLHPNPEVVAMKLESMRARQKRRDAHDLGVLNDVLKLQGTHGTVMPDEAPMEHPPLPQ